MPGVGVGWVADEDNMGVGMLAVVAADRADAAVTTLNAAGERAWIAGEIAPGAGRTVLA